MTWSEKKGSVRGPPIAYGRREGPLWTAREDRRWFLMCPGHGPSTVGSFSKIPSCVRGHGYLAALGVAFVYRVLSIESLSSFKYIFYLHVVVCPTLRPFFKFEWLHAGLRSAILKYLSSSFNQLKSAMGPVSTSPGGYFRQPIHLRGLQSLSENVWTFDPSLFS